MSKKMNFYVMAIFLSLSAWSSLETSSQDSSQAVALAAVRAPDLPSIITATDTLSDPWYPYAKRPLFSSPDTEKLYGAQYLNEIRARTNKAVNHVPWTLSAPKTVVGSEPFKLKDVVVDRITDPKTGKKYVKLYHGTTADLVDVFKKGASAIRFDVAELTALGQGFYLAANMNEAKFYSCERLGTRKLNNPQLKSLLLVVGVLENDLIKGKLAEPDSERQSDDKTGEPYDTSVFFVRNSERNNQFVFFKNVAPYLKIFDLIILPDGFGKAKDRQDGDGRPVTSDEPEKKYGFTCPY